jgi:hypothetical protein
VELVATEALAALVASVVPSLLQLQAAQAMELSPSVTIWSLIQPEAAVELVLPLVPEDQAAPPLEQAVSEALVAPVVLAVSSMALKVECA